MRVFESKVIINQPIDSVWSYLTDWENAPKWMSGVDELKALGEIEAGTKLVFVARGAERGSEIVECDTGKKIILRSVQGAVSADYSYHLKSVGDETELTLVATCEMNSLLMKIMSPIIRFGMKMVDSKQPTSLKHYIESK